jgi:5-hydroxyisourate hydrolase
MSISTHVLDLAAGSPAAGVGVRFERQTADGFELQDERATDTDGRVADFVADGPGVYRLVFDVDSSYPGSFFPVAVLTFRVDDAAAHLHVPLLLSPYGFSTYRGS